jgi:putative endonuclease
MDFYVYIIYSVKLGRFYIGQTNNVEERFQRHNSGYEAYTSKGLPWILCWFACKSDRKSAVQLELKLKNLSKERIIKFIENYSEGVPSPDVFEEIKKSGC